MKAYVSKEKYNKVLLYLLKHLPKKYKYEKCKSINLLEESIDTIFLIHNEDVSYVICPDKLIDAVPPNIKELEDVSEIPIEALTGSDGDEVNASLRSSLKRIEKYIPTNPMIQDIKEQIENKSKHSDVIILRLFFTSEESKDEVHDS